MLGWQPLLPQCEVVCVHAVLSLSHIIYLKQITTMVSSRAISQTIESQSVQPIRSTLQEVDKLLVASVLCIFFFKYKIGKVYSPTTVHRIINEIYCI